MNLALALSREACGSRGSAVRLRRSVMDEHNYHNSNLSDHQDQEPVVPAFPEEETGGEECDSLYFLLDFSHQYYIPFIIMIGLIGNLLSCLVFLHTHLKMRSSSIYLAALSMTDFSFLFSLLLVWVNNTIGWKVFNKNVWCESVVYVSSVCSSLSVWLIVAFTVERFILLLNLFNACFSAK